MYVEKNIFLFLFFWPMEKIEEMCWSWFRVCNYITHMSWCVWCEWHTIQTNEKEMNRSTEPRKMSDRRNRRWWNSHSKPEGILGRANFITVDRTERIQYLFINTAFFFIVISIISECSFLLLRSWPGGVLRTGYNEEAIFSVGTNAHLARAREQERQRER